MHHPAQTRVQALVIPHEAGAVPVSFVIPGDRWETRNQVPRGTTAKVFVRKVIPALRSAAAGMTAERALVIAHEAGAVMDFTQT
jgi:hypothetical protein